MELDHHTNMTSGRLNHVEQDQSEMKSVVNRIPKMETRKITMCQSNLAWKVILNTMNKM